MKIWSIPHTKFAAMHMVSQIQKLGHVCSLVSEIIPEDDDIYIIYGAKDCPVLPKNYIVYQTEIAGSHFFDEKYFRIIKNAIAVWEYSKDNTGAYQHKRISIVYPGINPQPLVPKDISILFYGWIDGSVRRQKILEIIQRQLQIKVVTNVLGSQMWDLLNRSKVVLNLHYYDNSPLEVFRINEALSHNCMVVSEPPLSGYFGLIETESTPASIALKLAMCLMKEYNPVPATQRLCNLYQIKNALRIVRGVKSEAFFV